MLRKFLLAVPLVFAAAIIGAITTLKSLDFTEYRDLIAEMMSAATGREVTISGDLEFELSLDPALAVNNIRIANAAWGSQPEMVTIGRLEVRVALLPLFSGDIQIQHVALMDSDILLETNSDGEGNWVFSKPTTPKKRPDEEDRMPLPVIGNIELRNLQLTWLDGMTGEAIPFQLDRLVAHAEGASTPVKVDLSGRLDGEPFQLSGDLNAFKEFTAGGPLALNLTTKAAGTTIKLDGRITDPRAAKGINLKISAEGADLSQLSKLAGMDLPPIAPWTAELTLLDQPTGFRANDIQMHLGKSDFSGNLNIVLPEGKAPLLKAELHSGLLDLVSLQGAKGEAQPGLKKDKVFSSEPLAIDGVKTLNAAISYSADKVKTRKLVLEKLTTDLNLKDGVLEIKPLKFKVTDSVAHGTIRLNATEKEPRLSLKLSAKGLDVGRLLKTTLDEDTLSGKGDLSIDLKGQGSSVAAIMASLNGHSRLLMEKGELKSSALDTFVGGLSTLGGVLVAEKKKSATLNCLASDFNIKDGVATSRTLLADTEHSTVFGEGNINLGKETLDLLVKPKPKSVTLNVALPVRIGGTLAKPTFEAEKITAARKAVGLLAVFAFPPAVLIGLGEMGSGEQNPCLRIAQSMESKPAATAGEPVEEKQEGSIQATLEGIGNKLKGLFGG